MEINILEEHWLDYRSGPKEARDLINALQSKYADRDNVVVRIQYSIEHNKDRIVVIQRAPSYLERTEWKP